MLRYFLISLIVFLGPLVGITLISFKKEEYIYKKYFILIQRLILIIILIFTFNYLLLIFLVLIFFIFKNKGYLFNFLGLVLYNSFNDLEYLLLNSTLIFIYGMVSGYLIEKNRFNFVVGCSPFLLFALLPFLIPNL